ncbi:MAG: hypothetical protein R2838_03565 [Caldilineaceae bacterium]
MLGIPRAFRTAGRGLQNGIAEMKLRRNGETGELFALDNLVADVEAVIAAETDAIMATRSRRLLINNSKLELVIIN